MNLVAQADDLPVYDYEYDEMHVEDQWHETCLERSTPEENYAYTVLDGDSEFWALMNHGNGELLYCSASAAAATSAVIAASANQTAPKL